MWSHKESKEVIRDKKEERILTRTNGRKKLPPFETEQNNPNNVLVLHVKRKSTFRDSSENIKCI